MFGQKVKLSALLCINSSSVSCGKMCFSMESFNFLRFFPFLPQCKNVLYMKLAFHRVTASLIDYLSHPLCRRQFGWRLFFVWMAQKHETDFSIKERGWGVLTGSENEGEEGQIWSRPQTSVPPYRASLTANVRGERVCRKWVTQCVTATICSQEQISKGINY